jgi:hypothetical protein
MSRAIHIIGNGDNAVRYKPSKGIKLTCNLPPFAIDNVYATCIVDFKMMSAINQGIVTVPGEWIVGFRPKKWCEMNPAFYMKYAPQIKTFYLDKPEYVPTYTDFNCGHMATHFAANKLKGDEIHLYGFDSMFDFNLRSYTDTFMTSDRSDTNNARLTNNWRSIWPQLFNEFPNTQFVLHHKHDKLKYPKPKNVEIITT